MAKASDDIMVAVSKANTKKPKEASTNGRKKFITYEMEMPVPYCVYSEISSESAVWEGIGRCTRDTANIVPIQEGGDY